MCGNATTVKATMSVAVLPILKAAVDITLLAALSHTQQVKLLSTVTPTHTCPTALLLFPATSATQAHTANSKSFVFL